MHVGCRRVKKGSFRLADFGNSNFSWVFSLLSTAVLFALNFT